MDRATNMGAARSQSSTTVQVCSAGAGGITSTRSSSGGCCEMDTVVWNRPNHCVMMQRRRMCGCCVAWGGDAHGGVYCEGDSPYNLERHLQTHPELYAVDADGNSTKFSIDAVGIRVRLSNTSIPGPSGFYHACPSRPENQEFVAESLTWLIKNLELGGVQIETGDTGVCQCSLSRDRWKRPAEFGSNAPGEIRTHERWSRNWPQNVRPCS